ncbi:hypothetical protein SteCoe_33852 [Stentor coeruleus]|uniref:Uncharacterized protein n=1 Tax=Stentor coeruleus TaxID=5963 RepID=A0A1R2AVT6_9CILI|nr:hypothetical protein SteCoe_33852 [Stentor coeruleus]
MELNSDHLIGNIESIKSILNETSYQVLSNHFSTYRKIPPHNQNLLKSLAVCIFDLSTIYKISEIICYMNHYRSVYDSQYSLNDKHLIVDALNKVYQNLISEEILEQKINTLNIIYSNHIHHLTLLLRECAIYSAITLYNMPKYSEYSKNNPFDVFFLKLYNHSSELSFDDLDMFFCAFSLHVHLINPITYDVCEYNTEGKYSIFFLDLPQGYYPLHTLDIYSIVVNSYAQHIHQIIPYEKVYLAADLEEVKEKYNILNEKKIKGCKELIYITCTGFEGTTIDNINERYHIKKDLKNALLGFYCHYCRRFGECFRLSCGHYFCENEFNYIAYGKKLCIICGNDVSKDIDTIYSKINHNY